MEKVRGKEIEMAYYLLMADVDECGENISFPCIIDKKETLNEIQTAAVNLGGTKMNEKAIQQKGFKYILNITQDTLVFDNGGYSVYWTQKFDG